MGSSPTISDSTRNYLYRLNNLLEEFNDLLSEYGMDASIQPIEDIGEPYCTKEEMAPQVKSRYKSASTLAGALRDSLGEAESERLDAWVKDLDSVFIFVISLLDPPAVDGLPDI